MIVVPVIIRFLFLLSSVIDWKNPRLEKKRKMVFGKIFVRKKNAGRRRDATLNGTTPLNVPLKADELSGNILKTFKKMFALMKDH